MEYLALQSAASGQPMSDLNVFGIPNAAPSTNDTTPLLQRLAEVINNGYAISNQNVSDNLDRLNAAIMGLGYPNNSFRLRVTGGDRYLDANGNVRSSTTHEIVRRADRTSSHIVTNGARAADLSVEGVPDDVFDRALRETDFDPAMTEREYDNGHTHISLPRRLGLPQR
jgi:hypothetical protein